MIEWLDHNLKRLTVALAPCAHCPIANTERGINLPGSAAIIDVLQKLITILYPGCHGTEPIAHDAFPQYLEQLLREVALEFSDQLQRAFQFQCPHEKCINCHTCRTKAHHATIAFLESLSETHALLQSDIKAAYDGDPAAASTMEVVMSYPGLYAITVHRLAHTLYQLKVPLIPRVMSEHAHCQTGIDIHPGAVIGSGFFIDHGTGVVIGETCNIGHNVKVYQGVTLGALSFAKDEETGALIKGVKRHPDVEDNVVIYAGATILGGDTVIGKDSVIGGNVWLVHSVPPGSKVYNQTPKPAIKLGGTRAYTYSI